MNTQLRFSKYTVPNCSKGDNSCNVVIAGLRILQYKIVGLYLLIKQYSTTCSQRATIHGKMWMFVVVNKCTMMTTTYRHSGYIYSPTKYCLWHFIFLNITHSWYNKDHTETLLLFPNLCKRWFHNTIIWFCFWRSLTRGQSSIRPSIYFSLIVKSRSNPFPEPTSTKQ